jgi:hypothetical protein
MIRIAKDESVLRRRELESEYSPDFIFASGQQSRALNARDFVELKSGQQAPLQGTVRVPVPAAYVDVPGFPRAGKHVLSFEPVFWMDPDEARGQWSRLGKKTRLVTTFPFTEPIPFVIPDSPRFGKCP